MDPAGNGGGDPPANRSRGVVSDAEGRSETNAPAEGQQESVETAPQQEVSNQEAAAQQQQQLQIQPYQPPQDANAHPFGAPPPANFQHHQQQGGYPFPPAWSPHHGVVGPPHVQPAPPPPPRPGQQLMQPGSCPHPQQQTQHAAAMAFYEARMRDHAAAYASAAAGAAWAAAQIAQQAAEFAAVTHARGPGMPPIPSPPLDPSTGLPSPASFGAPGFFPPDAGYCPVMAGGAADPNYFQPSSNSPPGGGLNHNSPPWHGSCHPYNPNNSNNDNPWPNDRGQPIHNKNNNKNNNSDGNYDEAYATRNTRRKRTQRRPPGGISIPRQDQQPPSAVTAGNNNNSRVRRRLRDQGDSSNSSCATSITSYNSDQPYTYNDPNHHNNNLNGGGGCHNNRGNGGWNYGGPHPRGGGPRGGGNHYHRYKKRMKQPKDDTSLLGKTGVSALFEWCGKRRIQPSFALLAPLHGSNVSVEAGEEFEMAVYLEDGVEVGRGHGPSKGSAKQDAARKALQTLVPGIVFDAGTGFVVELPESMVPPHLHAAVASSTSNIHQRGENVNPASLEDLAPHLASRLAIASGRDDDNEDGGKMAARVSGPQSYSKTLKRAWSVNPGTTSTTSEEDDENAYYASRGASVCSVLLHAMVQIDDRIPEAPQYEFVVSKVPTANAQMKRKGPASSYGSTIVIQRGPFTCTATLKVLVAPAVATVKDKDDNGADPEATEVSSDNDEAKQSSSQLAKAEEEYDQPTDCNVPESPKSNSSLTILTAVGVGGTKRESKHTASAKLLALLFPECKTMVEVKAAAEAAREAYAASKALNKNNNNANSRRRREGRSKMPRLSLSYGISQLKASDDDPPLPPGIVKELQKILGVQKANTASTICSQVASFEKLNLNQDSSSDVGEAKSESEDGGPDLDDKKPPNSRVDRPASRRKQLDAQVDKALAMLNEHDEEGRSLPGELTVDDVGRTVLRRAEPEDIQRIRRLLSRCTANSNDADCFCPASVLGPMTEGDVAGESNGKCADEADRDDRALQLWGSSTIVLLLCRAIAAFEDPPLGCAVLTLGFSMQKGRLLRIAQIGSEKHLPRERFLECLEAFASSMQYSLERQESPPSGEQARGVVRMDRGLLKAVLQSNLQPGAKSPSAKNGCERSRNVSAPLQSVLEESEGGDDSDRPKESSGATKGQDKPCKRSRVE